MLLAACAPLLRLHLQPAARLLLKTQLLRLRQLHQPLLPPCQERQVPDWYVAGQ